MKKQHRILLAALLITVTAVLVWRQLRPPESIWLGKLIRTNGNSKEAVSGFQALGPKAVPFLVHTLTNTSPLRNKYVTAKSSVSSGKIYRLLPTWSIYRDWQRKKYAAFALGVIGEPASNAVPTLIAAVNRTEKEAANKSARESNAYQYWPEARIEAIRALGKIAPKSPEVVSALVAALTQNYPGISRVGDAAADVLAGIGPESKQFIPKLIENLKYHDKLQYRGPTMVAVYPVGLLGPGEGGSVPRLIPALKGLDAEGRAAAAYDLGTIKKEDAAAAKPAIPELVRLLDDNVAEVRLCAAEAIANIDPEKAIVNIPALIELLQDTSWRIRIRAVEELRKLGPRASTAIPALKERLTDEAAVVRLWSEEAIREMEQRKER